MVHQGLSGLVAITIFLRFECKISFSRKNYIILRFIVMKYSLCRQQIPVLSSTEKPLCATLKNSVNLSSVKTPISLSNLIFLCSSSMFTFWLLSLIVSFAKSYYFIIFIVFNGSLHPVLPHLKLSFLHPFLMSQIQCSLSLSENTGQKFQKSFSCSGSDFVLKQSMGPEF